MDAFLKLAMITTRTKQGIDASGEAFADYSDAYGKRKAERNAPRAPTKRKATHLKPVK